MSGTSIPLPQAPVTVRQRSLLEIAVQAFSRNRAAVFGLFLVVALALLALLADIVSPATRGGMGDRAMLPPGGDHLMGTDDLARDVFHRFVHGARISLSIGALAAVTSMVLGVTVGLFSGYRGGTVDDLLMRFTEAIQVTPRFFLALVVVVLFGASLQNIILIIGLLSWPAIARLIRAETLTIREQEYVQAARIVGVRDRSIMFRHILPNALPPTVVAGSLLVSQAILIESALSFLGLGDPSRASWGLMLNQANTFLRVAWWLAFFPGIGILLASLGFNLVGDGLNEALNPRLRQR
jgi:peptide/nickel transport system permease protein